ncbi:hypothetical protein CCACVL1_06827 [Corchorus capsularis]|uniref:Uncharacterized protein n=1 Tax=Corchorus capsularis TaxID=210143 RepID=A0A1R3JCF6_COCAP|nr:hypothetical protein CCACVL1_06827 [Corchorus capsularis]
MEVNKDNGIDPKPSNKEENTTIAILKY